MNRSDTVPRALGSCIWGSQEPMTLSPDFALEISRAVGDQVSPTINFSGGTDARSEDVTPT